MSVALSIRRLRLHGDDCDRLRGRRRMEQELDDLDLPSLRQSPTAVLCVRSLRTEFTRSSSARLAESLEQLFKSAARPARQPPPANAVAVVFDDHAELLACLALDWLRHNLVNQWWWASLFPSIREADLVSRAWRAEPQLVPAALDRLHQAGAAISFLSALPADLCGSLCGNVAAVHAVDGPRRAIQAARAAVAANLANLRATTAASPAMVLPPTSNPHENPPWRQWIAEEPDAPAEVMTLLTLSVMLVRASAELRSTRFTRRLVEFTEHLAPPPAPSPRHTQTAPSPLTSSGSAPGLLAAPTPQLSSQDLPAQRADNQTCDDEFPQTPHLPPRAKTSPGVFSLQQESPLLPAAPLSKSQSASPAEFVPLSNHPDPWTVSTQWGGIFYLVNVALALEFYGDFTQPRTPSLPLSVWDFLALLGAALIGPALESDPAWPALAVLSGRAADEPPGVAFEPAANWRPPPSWPGSVWDATVDSTSASWFRCLADSVTARLCQAIEEPDPAIMRETVFHHDAHLNICSDRLSVRFSLARHPIALRLAGLDRDPGWVPAGGRIIAFHYD